MKKLIAVDIDGTLITSDMVISERTKEVMIKAQEAGHIIVISSGRSPKGVEQYYKELELDKYGGYICNYNGAMATNVKTGKIAINHILDFEKTKDLLAFAEGLDINYIIYHNNMVYANNLKAEYLDDVLLKNDMLLKYVPDLSFSLDFEVNNILFMQDPVKIKEPADKIYEKYKDDFELVYSEAFYFEAMPKGVSKGTTLLELADLLGIAKEDTIAFGDQENDRDMISKAGVGVAMGNAVDSVKAVADYVTLTNNEDGIADYLEKFVL